MSTLPRDTQFIGFAQLLRAEVVKQLILLDVDISLEQQAIIDALIAKRAYDLVWHTLAHIDQSSLPYQPLVSIIPAIPDMTTWPPEDAAIFQAWLTTHPDPAVVEHALTPFRRRIRLQHGDR